MTEPLTTMKAMRRHVLDALTTLNEIRESLDDAMSMEVEDVVDAYRKEKQYARESGEPDVSDFFLQAIGGEIEDLCREYGYPALLPDGWDNPDPVKAVTP